MPRPAEHVPVVSPSDLESLRLDMIGKRLWWLGLIMGIPLTLGEMLSFSVRFIDSVKLPAGSPPPPPPEPIGRIILSLSCSLLCIFVGWRSRRATKVAHAAPPGRPAPVLAGLVRRAQLMVVLLALSLTPHQIFDGEHPIYLFPGLVAISFVHIIACFIVPWTWLEALVPAAATGLLLWLGAWVFGGQVDWGGRLIMLGAVGFACLPGTLITLIGGSRVRELLRLRLIGRRYAEVERELAVARRLHERLLPAAIADGPLRLAYAYEPMRQIGGDHLDVTRHADGSLTIAVIDVTGHGVAAALAANRLHGELKRILNQGPVVRPADVIAGLNQYVALTLADEEVFATAAVARAAPDGSVTLCVAGHPPPMLRGADGSVRIIEPTAMMLGVLTDDVFDAREAAVTLGPRDTLMIYTDGAVECRDRGGRQLGVEGLRRHLASVSPVPPQETVLSLMRAVTSHRWGGAEDDTLVMCLATAR